MKPKAIAKKLKTNVNLVYQVGWAMRKAKKQTPVYKKPKEDPKAKAWLMNNLWFGVDQKKTAYALGLHEELVNEGVNPKSDEYYRRIDKGMKAINKAKGEITATQKAIAKKLGITEPSKIVKDVTEMKQALDVIEKKPTKLIIQPQHKDTAMKLLAELDAAEKKLDLVNKPPHYTDGGVDTLKFIEAKDLNYRLGNVVKYISRAGKKVGSDPVQDLEKARFYLEREIEARRDA
jgi:hypothetical protein